jgi:cell wall-associated NlpC family hydrolase
MKNLMILLVLAGSLVGCAESKPPTPPMKAVVEWPAGTVLVSKNRDESQNKSPGDQNHLAIYVGNGEIIEAQADAGVIRTPFSVYNARDYIWFPEFPIDGTVGAKAAAKAKTLVGLPYRELSSLMRVEHDPSKGLNCVSVVRISYSYALGHNLPNLRKPDDILLMTDVFTRIWNGYKITVPDPGPPQPSAAVPSALRKAA